MFVYDFAFRLSTYADYKLRVSKTKHIVALVKEISGEFPSRRVKFISYYYIRSTDQISTDSVGCAIRFSDSLFLDLLCSYSCSGHFNFFDYIAYLVIVNTMPSLWKICKLFPSNDS
jgi:hypothetical protein